jgi:hypothetical protein
MTQKENQFCNQLIELGQVLELLTKTANRDFRRLSKLLHLCQVIQDLMWDQHQAAKDHAQLSTKRL